MRELLRQEIAPLKLEIEKINKTHDDLQTTVSLLSNKYDDLLSQYRPRNWQALSCFITKVTLSKAQKDIDESRKTANEAHMQTEELAQYIRRDCLDISGIAPKEELSRVKAS